MMDESESVRSPSRIAGIFPSGLIFRYSALTFTGMTSSRSCGMLFSARTTRTLRTKGDAPIPYRTMAIAGLLAGRPRRRGDPCQGGGGNWCPSRYRVGAMRRRTWLAGMVVVMVIGACGLTDHAAKKEPSEYSAERMGDLSDQDSILDLLDPDEREAM